MHKPKRTRQISRVLLIWVAVLVGLAGMAFAILFAIGIWNTTSDGNISKPLGNHVLTDKEKQEIKIALNADGEHPYPCINNTQDTCVHGSGMGYYPMYYNPNYFLENYKPDSAASVRQIYGKVTSFSSTLVQFQTSSGRLFEMKMSSYAFQTYAKYQAANKLYDPTTSGTTVLITYVAQPTDKTTEIDFNQVRSIYLSNPDTSYFAN